MSKDKFVFEWKIGDEVESKSSGEVSVISNECFSNPSRRYKPYGEAKKRYKAEKLAWQQSRMKEGDWVKDLVTGEKYQLELVSKRSGAFGDKEMPSLKSLKPCKPPRGRINLQIEVRNLTTDSILESLDDIERLEGKVPEPKLESENFKIEDGRLVYTGSCDGPADWGSVGEIDFSGEHFYQPSDVDDDKGLGCGFTNSSYLREIANLLDRSTAKRRS